MSGWVRDEAPCPRTTEHPTLLCPPQEGRGGGARALPTSPGSVGGSESPKVNDRAVAGSVSLARWLWSWAGGSRPPRWGQVHFRVSLFPSVPGGVGGRGAVSPPLRTTGARRFLSCFCCPRLAGRVVTLAPLSLPRFSVHLFGSRVKRSLATPPKGRELLRKATSPVKARGTVTWWVPRT